MGGAFLGAVWYFYKKWSANRTNAQLHQLAEASEILDAQKSDIVSEAQEAYDKAVESTGDIHKATEAYKQVVAERKKEIQSMLAEMQKLREQQAEFKTRQQDERTEWNRENFNKAYEDFMDTVTDDIKGQAEAANQVREGMRTQMEGHNAQFDSLSRVHDEKMTQWGTHLEDHERALNALNLEKIEEINQQVGQGTAQIGRLMENLKSKRAEHDQYTQQAENALMERVERAAASLHEMGAKQCENAGGQQNCRQNLPFRYYCKWEGGNKDREGQCVPKTYEEFTRAASIPVPKFGSEPSGSRFPGPSTSQSTAPHVVGNTTFGNAQ